MSLREAKNSIVQSVPDNLAKIKTYLLDNTGKETLSEYQQEMLTNYQTTYSLLLKYKSRRRAVPIIIKQFNCTTTTAYNYLRAAESLFGDVEELNKKIMRQIASEMALAVYNLALNTSNLGQMNKALSNYIKANNLDKDDPDLPDFTKLKREPAPIVLNVAFIEKYKDILDPTLIEQANTLLESKPIRKYKEYIDITPD